MCYQQTERVLFMLADSSSVSDEKLRVIYIYFKDNTIKRLYATSSTPEI